MMEELTVSNLKGKAKVVRSCTFRDLLWHMYKERNTITFEQNMASWWISSHVIIFNYSVLKIINY